MFFKYIFMKIPQQLAFTRTPKAIATGLRDRVLFKSILNWNTSDTWKKVGKELHNGNLPSSDVYVETISLTAENPTSELVSVHNFQLQDFSTTLACEILRYLIWKISFTIIRGKIRMKTII